jgi:hypothetical protein
MTTDLDDRIRALAAASDPARDPVTVEELRARRPGRRSHRPARVALGAVAAVLLVVLVAVAVRATTSDDGTDPEILVDAPTTTTTTSPGVPGWTPWTRELPATDPVVRAVLALLPEGARLEEALDIVDERPGGADYIRVVASAGGVEHEVSIHRTFDVDELSPPTSLPGARTWPGTTGPEYAYLYYLSDSGVGLHLSARGALDADVADDLMDLAHRIVADPLLGRIRAG